jgi:hypothetical protein
MPTRPPGHQYSCEVIRYVLQFVLRAATSLRGARSCLEVVKQRLGLEHVPAGNTVENWLLRIGLHELQRPKERAEDWAWLADHSVQIGPYKVLAIVGVRLSAWREAHRPLEQGDLSMMALQPMLTCNGLAVAGELEAAAAAHGPPRMIATDGGADLHKGISLFQQEHPQVAHVGDIAHKAALIVKRELGGDPRWNKYLLELGRSTQHAKHSALACLLAPAPRIKARYLNAYEQVRWGARLLQCLEAPRHLEKLGLDRREAQSKFGWIGDYRQALAEWDELIRVVGTTLQYVRVEGYSRQAGPHLRQRLDVPATSPAATVAARLSEYVAEQSKSACGNEHLIGSTEILESLFGKLKRLEAQQNQNGFTKLLLGMAASVATLTQEYLHTALSHIPTKAISEWCDSHLGTSLQANRHRALFSLAGTKTG